MFDDERLETDLLCLDEMMESFGENKYDDHCTLTVEYVEAILVSGLGYLRQPSLVGNFLEATGMSNGKAKKETLDRTMTTMDWMTMDWICHENGEAALALAKLTRSKFKVQMADIFTKNLTAEKYLQGRKLLCGW